MKFPSTIDKDPTLKRIGVWVSVQRREYHLGNLLPARAKKLEQIPGWSWNVPSDQWNESCEELIAFVEENGRFPSDKKEPEKHLGIWVQNRRKERKNARLSPDRIEQLGQIPGWSWEPYDNQWNEKYEILRQGNKNDYLKDWVIDQRRAKKKGKLSQVRVEQLERIPGWSWSIPNGRWKKQCEQVVSFVKKHNKIPVRTRRGNERVIGEWIVGQRKAYKKGELSQEKIEILEQISRWSWSPFIDKWEAIYLKVFMFVEREERVPSPESKDIEEASLGRWAGRHRLAYKTGKLPRERIDKLEQIPGWFWTRLGKAA